MRRVLWICLLALLAQALSAEEIYVRNRPFTGVVSKSGATLYVEVEVLAENLGASVSREGGVLVLGQEGGSSSEPVTSVMFGGESVPFLTGPGGEVLVPLDVATKSLGGRVVRDSSMGTIDIYLDEEKEESAQSSDDGPNVSTVAASSRTNPRLLPAEDEETQMWGYRDPDTKVWVIKPQFSEVRIFQEGLAAARDDKGQDKRVVNTNKYRIIGSYEGLSEADKRKYESGKERNVYTSRKKGKWGFIDARGRWIIEPQFDDVQDFKSQDLAGQTHVAARVDRGSYTYWIDTNGRVLRDSDKVSTGGGDTGRPGDRITVPSEPISITVKKGSPPKHAFVVKCSVAEWSFSIRCPKLREKGLSISPASGAIRGGPIKVDVQPMNPAKVGTYSGAVIVKSLDWDEEHTVILMVEVVE